MIPAPTPALIGAVAAGVGVVVALAGWRWSRGRAPQRIENPEEAAAAAEGLPGFAVTGAVVGADGRGALAVSADGRVAAVARAGSRLVAREVAWRVVRSSAEGILIETADARLGTVTLAGVDVLDIRRLAPKGLSA
jgi:hypothetical protein